jgi:predicted dehydrogenase
MTVRVGFLGAGLIATFHSKLLHVADVDVTWAGVFDPDTARAEQFANASGARVCSSEDEVLDTCDAVYVCTWTSEHPRLVEAAAERGRAVFCEKPLAVDLATADRMVNRVQQAGVINQVGLVLRRSPAFGLMKALAADPEGGRPMSIVFRDDQYIPIQGMYASTWRGDAAKAGSGTLLEHSIHDLDLLEWILGPITSVSARSASFHGLDGIEDSVAVSLAFDNGAVGTLVSVWHDMLERPSQRWVELFCERAYVALQDDWWGPVDWRIGDAGGHRAQGEELEAEAARRDALFGNPDAAFIEAVAAGTPAWPDFSDALRAHVLVDGVYRSAAAGGAPVAITPEPLVSPDG